MRLIDADELEKILIKSNDYHINNSREQAILDRTVAIVREQPTGDPVVHAKWEALASVRNPTWFKCSICGREIHLGDIEVLSDYPYCHCGAKMDEE